MDKKDLKTVRLEMRPLALGDANMLWPYVSDPRISSEMSWDAHKNISETIAFVEATIRAMETGKNITWCIFKGGKFCGIFSLIGILMNHRSLTYNRAELAYWLAGYFEKQGIMTEAGLKIIEFAFHEMKLHKLVVGHHITNVDSERLIKRLGFDYLYTEEEVFMKNGRWITCKFYELNSKNYFKKN